MNERCPQCGQSLIQPQSDWKSIDWLNKTVSQIAEETGYSTTTVTRYRLQLFGPHNKQVKRQYHKSIIEAKYGNLDWSLQDTVLSKVAGVSRERIRQARKFLGKPQPASKRKRTTETQKDKFVQWIRANSDRTGGMTISEMATEVGISDGYCAVLASEHQVPHRNALCKYDYPNVNFDLPNIDLARIWNSPPQNFTLYRYRNKLPQSKWHSLRGRPYSRNGATLEDYQKALELEKAKAKSHIHA